MSRGGSSCSEPAGLRTLVLTVSVLAVTAVAVASTTLVLVGGRSVEVAAAELRGDAVLVTRLDGRRITVDPQRVDLEASGLDPAPSPTSFGARGLVDVASLGAEGSGPAITDADVGHVERDGSGTGDRRTDAGGPGAGITVSGVQQTVSSSRATVSGTLTNTSGRIVEKLTLEVTALAADRTLLGHAAASLGEPLPPGASRRFSVPVTVSGPPAAVRLFVSGPVGQVLFDVSPP